MILLNGDSASPTHTSICSSTKNTTSIHQLTLFWFVQPIMSLNRSFSLFVSLCVSIMRSTYAGVCCQLVLAFHDGEHYISSSFLQLSIPRVPNKIHIFICFCANKCTQPTHIAIFAFAYHFVIAMPRTFPDDGVKSTPEQVSMR